MHWPMDELNSQWKNPLKCFAKRAWYHPGSCTDKRRAILNSTDQDQYLWMTYSIFIDDVMVLLYWDTDCH